LPNVFSKVTFCKQSLIKNANYLAKAMNNFTKGSINVERHNRIQRKNNNFAYRI
jgi:hypothetical protein